MDHNSQPSWLENIGLLRLAGFLEGATLITLLFVAVPMKRFLGEPGMVTIMGPSTAARLCSTSLWLSPWFSGATLPQRKSRGSW